MPFIKFVSLFFLNCLHAHHMHTLNPLIFAKMLWQQLHETQHYNLQVAMSLKLKLWSDTTCVNTSLQSITSQSSWPLQISVYNCSKFMRQQSLISTSSLTSMSLLMMHVCSHISTTHSLVTLVIPVILDHSSLQPAAVLRAIYGLSITHLEICGMLFQ